MCAGTLCARSDSSHDDQEHPATETGQSRLSNFRTRLGLHGWFSSPLQSHCRTWPVLSSPGEGPLPPGMPLRNVGKPGRLKLAWYAGMSFAYAPFVPDEECVSVIRRARELGITHLDTSDMYGPHTNEILVGKAIAGHRNDYEVCTKFGVVHGPTGMSVKGTREYVRSAVEGSLKRLNIDCIDLYYQHRVDREVPIEDTWAELKELVKEGKVKYLGISEASAVEIRRAHAVHPITACQLEWSLWTRDVEAEIIPTLRELGIGIIAYSPLGRGFLTGTIKPPDNLEEGDSRRNWPRFKKEAYEANMQLVERVKDLAGKKGCTPGQLALAWVHAQGHDVFPIPGTKRLKYLEENAAAFSIELTREDKQNLEDVFQKNKVVGDRYPEMAAKFSYDAHTKKTAAA